MPNAKTKTVDNDGVVFNGFAVNNTPVNPIRSKGRDFSSGKCEHFHLQRKGEGVEVVSDGFVDGDALIQSEKCNAGLENIIKMQTIRYGTIQNAIKRNEDKQVFADLSKVPTTVAEQQEYIAKSEKELNDLCNKLGISKEDLLKSNLETLTQLVKGKNETSQPAEGGNE